MPTPTPESTPTVQKTEVRKLFFVSDVHFPYACNELIKSVFHFIGDFNPDILVQGGDLVDFYALSTYSKDPTRLLSLQDELEYGRGFWKKVRELCPNAELYMKEGNHEARLQHVLYSKPELSPLRALALTSLLGLDKYDVKFYRTHERLVFHECLQITHGSICRNKSGYSAMAELEKRGINGISGHVHRAGKILSSRNGQTLAWVESGFLGDTGAGFEFMGDCEPNWQHAVTVAYFYKAPTATKWNVKLDLVEADKEHNFLYNGKFYTPKGVVHV